MEVLLFLKIGMLIAVSIIGWVIGRKWKMSSKDISTLLVYGFSIRYFFFDTRVLSNPGYFKYSIGAFLTSGLFGTEHTHWQPLFGVAQKETFFLLPEGPEIRYFALPIILSLFEPSQWAVAIFIIIGVNIYEFTLGYFITAKGTFNTRDCVKKGAIAAHYICNHFCSCFKYMGVAFHHEVLSFMDNFKGAYSVLGMMVIGMTLAPYGKLEFDWKFSIASIGWKHVCIPVVGVLFFTMLGIDENSLLVIALMLATPMAGNVVVIANQLGVHPR